MLEAGEAAAFHGVGRLNIAGSRFCTATLVAPDVIATAAHCLFHPQTGKRVRNSELRFVAGYRIKERAALRRVTRTVVDPAYAFDGRATYAGVGTDLALGRLDAPVPEAVNPFATAAFDPAAVLSIVSYGQDRPHAPSVESPCGIVEQTGPVLALDCAVTYGASGSPLFQGGGRRPAPRRRRVGDGAPDPPAGRRHLRPPARGRLRATPRHARRGAALRHGRGRPASPPLRRNRRARSRSERP